MFDAPLRLLDVFRSYVDICAPPSPGLLQYMASATGDARLEQFAEGGEAYSRWVQEEKPSLLSLAQRYGLSCADAGPRRLPFGSHHRGGSTTSDAELFYFQWLQRAEDRQWLFHHG